MNPDREKEYEFYMKRVAETICRSTGIPPHLLNRPASISSKTNEEAMKAFRADPDRRSN